MADGSIRYSIVGDLSGLTTQLLQAEARAAQTGTTVGRNISSGINTQLMTVGSSVIRQGTQIGNNLSTSINSSFSLRGVNATVASTFNGLPATASASGSRTGAAFNNSFTSGVSDIDRAVTRPIDNAVNGLRSMGSVFSNIGTNYGQAIGTGMGRAIDSSQGFLARRMNNIWQSATDRVSEVIQNGLSSAMSMATGLLSDMVRVGREAEAMKTTFGTLMGSKAKGVEVFNQGEQFAKDTPFSNDQTFGAMQQMLALSKYRKDTKLMIKDLKAVGDVAAGTGKDLSQVAYVYSQVQTQGRAMGEDLNQLANAGIPIHEALGKAMGKPVAQVKELASKGKVTAEVMAKTFQQLTTGAGQFAGAMVNMGATVDGQIASFQGGMDMLKGQIFSGLTKPMGTAMMTLNTGLMNVINKGDLVKGLTATFAQMGAMVEKNKVAITAMVEQGFKGAQDALLIMAQKAKEFMAWLSTPSGREAIAQIAVTSRDLVGLLGQLTVLAGQLAIGFVKVDAEVRDMERTFNQVAVISRKLWLSFVSQAQNGIDAANLLFSNMDADLAMFESSANRAWSGFVGYINGGIASYNNLDNRMQAGITAFEGKVNRAWAGFTTGVGNAINSIIQAGARMLAFAGNIFSSEKAAYQLGAGIRNAIISAINVCITGVGRFTNFLSSSVQAAVNVGGAIANFIGNAITNAINSVGRFTNSLSRGVQSAVNVGGAILRSIGGAIQSAIGRWNNFNTSIRNAGGIIAIVTGAINGALRSALTTVSNVAVSIWRNFRSSATSAFSTVTSIATSFKNFIAGIPNAIAEGFQSAAKSVGAIFEGWTAKAKELAAAATSFVRGLSGVGGGGDGSGAPVTGSGSILSALPGSLQSWTMTSPRGQRNGRLHAGVDIGAPEGTPVYAPFNARVTGMATDMGEFLVKFEGLVDNIKTVGKFIHLSKLNVRPGDTITKGQRIGAVGGRVPSWKSTGAHLHYELYQNGRFVDPYRVSAPNRAGRGGDADIVAASERAAQKAGMNDPHAGHNHGEPAKKSSKGSLNVRLDRPPIKIPPSEEQQRQRTLLGISKQEALSAAARSARDLETTRNRGLIDKRHEVEIGRTKDPLEKQLKEFAHQAELIERARADFNRKFNDEIEDATTARAKKVASADKSDQTNYSGRINTLTSERQKGQAEFDLDLQKLQEEQSRLLIETNEKLGESYSSLMGTVADLHATYGLNTPEEAHNDKLRSIRKTAEDLSAQLKIQITAEEQLATHQGKAAANMERLNALKGSLTGITQEMTKAINAENAAYQESLAVQDRERLAVSDSLTSQVNQAQAGALDKRGDVFGADKIRRADAIGTLDREAATQEREMRAKAKEGGWSPEFLDAQLAKLQQLNQFKLTDINAQFQTLGEAIKSKLGDELQGILTGLFEGTKSMMDMLRDSFASIGKWLLQLGIKGLMGSFGFNLGGIGGFSKGGMIENFATGGSIGDAFRKERSESGLQPRLIVANVGERVLSADETANYNRLFPRGIPNFASGGLVGVGTMPGAGASIAINSPVTVQANGSSEVNPTAMRNLQEGLNRQIAQYMLAQAQPNGLIDQIIRNRM